MKVRKIGTEANAADLALMVESTTQETIMEYDKAKIVESLIKEAHCPEYIAIDVAETVTNKLKQLDLKTLTPALIRNFVNVILFEKGFSKELKSDSEIIMSTHDLESMIFNTSKENGNTSHNPESINLAIAERILKEYALKKVFSPDVREFHLSGDGHVHDMGMVTRLYCSGHSPEYIKKHGLKNIPNIPSTSDPAKSAEVLARHLASATLFFTSLFAGAIGFEAVNMFFAPMLRGYSYKKIKQLAQTFMFDFSQLAGAKGGQVSFTDLNIYPRIPNHYRDVLAMGAGGKYIVEDNLGDTHYFDEQSQAKEWASQNECKPLTYKDFEKESRMFAKALLEVSMEGDALGLPFAFPKIHLHINQECLDDKKANAIIKYACKVLSKMGNPYVDFDRNAMSVSQCCRLQIEFTEEDKLQIQTPDELRFVGGQNVSINLANLPLKVGKDEDAIYAETDRRMEIATKAHTQRLEYIKKLVNAPNSPLKFYDSGMDYKPYVRYDRISWLIGIVGLNEYVYNLMGKQMHESKEMFIKGMELITFMNHKCKEMSKKYNMNIKLEETPAESTANRFAKLDIKKYGDKAFHQENEYGVYYTNSVHFAVNAPVDYIDRLKEQSKFHQVVEAGSMIHNWVGDRSPSPEAIYNLMKNTWEKTKCVEATISPDKTTCYGCKKTTNGFHDKCPLCSSENVFWTTRITGYQVRVDNFNDGKRAELEDRKREIII